MVTSRESKHLGGENLMIALMVPETARACGFHGVSRLRW